MLSGSLVALVTPMKSSGDIDWPALDALIDWHLQSGTHGIVPVGTTGESATLNVREHSQVVAATVKRVDGRIPVVAGTGANATARAITLTREAKAAGADACLLVTPYYNKPTQEGLYRHYCTIAESVDVPMVLYNVPSRTACDMVAKMVARLAPVDQIIGIKEACGDTNRVKEIRELVSSDFLILSGEDAQTLTMLNYGAVGTISVTANVVPHLMSKFCQVWRNGERDKAAEVDAMLQPLHAALFVETNPIPTKWALNQMGKIDTGIRLPLTELSETQRDFVYDALKLLNAL